MSKINFVETIKSKIFSNADKFYYFFPIAFSFLFFFKIGDTSYWFDELVTVNTIDPDTTKDFFNNYFRNELHPPLYFVVLKIFAKLVTLLTESAKMLWLTLYNYSYSSVALKFLAQDIVNVYNQYFAFYFPHKINNLSEFSVRLLSAMSMAAVNIVIFNFFRKNSSILIGLLVCVFIGLNHKMINFAQDARPYALFTLLFVFVTIEFYSAYKKTLSIENFKKLMLLNILLALTHYYGIFVMLAQVLILSIIHFKNKKIIISAIFLFVSYAVGVHFLDQIVNLSPLTFLQKGGNEVLLSIYKAVFGFFSVKVLIVCLCLVVLKFLIKKSSKVDEILIKSSVFLLSIVLIIQVTGLIRAIFYERYVLFLIPLFTVIYTLLLYSAAETVTFRFKDKNLKLIAFLSLCLFAAFRMTHLAYANTFYVISYFESGKYYPIKNAYEKISEDTDYKPGAPYVLEEYIPEYFRYYENLYQIKPVLNLNPNLKIDEKNAQLQSLAATLNENVIYYIKVKKPHLQDLNQGPLVLPGYSKHILFNQQSILLFKFAKEK